MDYQAAAPAGYAAIDRLNAYVEDCGLDYRLLKLVTLRASQINGCAYCLEMHGKAARRLGEQEERLDMLAAWRESPAFSARERAALAWTEALTLVADSHVPDDVFAEAQRHFGAKELVDLTWAVVVINGWNRVAIGFHAVPGT